MPPKKVPATPAAPAPAKRPRLPPTPDFASRHQDPAPVLGAASSVTPSFAALPLDILQLILGFIPLRPRLLVAALTCTRWREAARRATTALPGHLALAAYGAACKCLPLVASLSITLPPRDFTFPTVITSLSTLTSLEVRMELRSSPDWLAGLLENNVASLTSLSAHLTQQATPFVAEHLIQARLPSLHTLSLQWYRWARVSLASVAPVTALVTAYSSQLLSLSLVCHDPALFLASPTSFPRLTRFVANNLKAGEVDAIVKAAPQLTNLGTTVAGCPPPSWFPLLSHLFVPDKDAIHSCIFEQANATATLTSMSANLWKLPTPLRLVHVRSVEAIFFTHNHSHSVFEIFPNLTSLALCGTATGMAVLNALLEEYVVSTVPLRRLSLSLINHTKVDVDWFNKLQELLPQAEKRGLECLHIRAEQGVCLDALRAIPRTLWLDFIIEVPHAL